MTEAKEKGVAPFEQALELVKGKVITAKKAKMFIDKIEAKRGSAKTIDELAAALNVSVKNAEKVSFASSYVPNLGVEPAVIGTVFSTKPGQLSNTVEGNAGVYVIVIDKMDEPVTAFEPKTFKQQTNQQLQQRATYEVFNALKEKANIVDNRGKFY
jgi:peptidyl-prolyl cis-trans isomerase D